MSQASPSTLPATSSDTAKPPPEPDAVAAAKIQRSGAIWAAAVANAGTIPVAVLTTVCTIYLARTSIRGLEADLAAARTEIKMLAHDANKSVIIAHQTAQAIQILGARHGFGTVNGDAYKQYVDMNAEYWNQRYSRIPAEEVRRLEDELKRRVYE